MDTLQLIIQTVGDMQFWVGIGRLIWPVFIGVDVVLVLLIGFVVDRMLEMRPKLNPFESKEKKIFTLRDVIFKERWASIQKKVASDRVDMMKLAIIEADKLADDILKHSGYQGEHMADRLVNIAPDQLKSLSRLWRAHRLRNDLVHTVGFQLSKEQAQAALRDFEEFFKEAGMLG